MKNRRVFPLHGSYQVVEVSLNRFRIHKDGKPVGPVYSSHTAAEADALALSRQDKDE